MVATVTELRTSSAAVEYYEKDGLLREERSRAPQGQLLARGSRR